MLNIALVVLLAVVVLLMLAFGIFLLSESMNPFGRLLEDWMEYKADRLREKWEKKKRRDNDAPPKND